ncbi:hypothetical protein A20C1_01766 [marine actinobacterium PHSC20C1]|nr:hypothetical protein A20C1_01766 [marine actinobacterium PHSC20C1]
MDDTIYLYGSSPISALTHMCVVEQVGIPFEERINDDDFWADSNALLERKARPWMRLRLIHSFSEQERRVLSLESMKLNGLQHAPQSRKRMPEGVAELIARELAVVKNFWWVNQGGTADRRQDFQHLWAPLTAADGRRMRHWDSLDEAKAGDVVVHYSHGYVIGSSQVSKASSPMARPADFETGAVRDDIGREVWLHHFREFEVPVELEAIPLELRRDDLGEGSPFEHSGKVQQGYFFPIVSEIAGEIFKAAGLLESGPTDGAERSEASAGDPFAQRQILLDATDGKAIVSYRKEQSGLRKLLFGTKVTERCGICAREYPVQFLHTAHIKSRSACALEERGDWKNVVMPACLFGCDALFERSFLNVGPDGVIQLQGNYNETPSLAAFAKSLEGKVVRAFTPTNRVYFEWRNNQLG